MTFRLTIDVPAWHRTQEEAAARFPGLVPVIKGNGYGFGSALLSARATALRAETVGVGVSGEIASVRAGFAGQILVMAPLQMSELDAFKAGDPDPSVLRTVAHPDVLRALAQLPRPPRIVLELDSPVHRHGIPPEQLLDLVPALRHLTLAGLALHLPSTGDRWPAAQAALQAVGKLRKAGVDPGTLWVSHLSSAQVARLAEADPLTRIRPRVGTSLWLGNRSNFVVSGTVLDAHAAPRNEAVGYRQRRSAAGTILVVSGGTAHGVGLQGASARGGLRDLARAALAGAAHGAGLAPSPFRWAGKRLRYADVPHMQISMLLVGSGVTPPVVGDRLTCDVRMTVTTFDEIEMISNGTSTGVKPFPATVPPPTTIQLPGDSARRLPGAGSGSVESRTW